jgi:hypothetical protein
MIYLLIMNILIIYLKLYLLRMHRDSSRSFMEILGYSITGISLRRE